MKKGVMERDIHANMPTVSEAMERLHNAIDEAERKGIAILKIIHGYGSTGDGGKIGEAARAELKKNTYREKIVRVIHGENWSIYKPETQNVTDRHPEASGDSDLDKTNTGITILELRSNLSHTAKNTKAELLKKVAISTPESSPRKPSPRKPSPRKQRKGSLAEKRRSGAQVSDYESEFPISAGGSEPLPRIVKTKKIKSVVRAEDSSKSMVGLSEIDQILASHPDTQEKFWADRKEKEARRKFVLKKSSEDPPVEQKLSGQSRPANFGDRIVHVGSRKGLHCPTCNSLQWVDPMQAGEQSCLKCGQSLKQ